MNFKKCLYVVFFYGVAQAHITEQYSVDGVQLPDFSQDTKAHALVTIGTNRPLLEGKAHEGSEVKLFIDGFPVGSRSESEKRYSFGYSSNNEPLAEGIHEAKAVLSDGSKQHEVSSPFVISTCTFITLETPMHGVSIGETKTPVSGMCKPHSQVTIIVKNSKGSTIVTDSAVSDSAGYYACSRLFDSLVNGDYVIQAQTRDQQGHEATAHSSFTFHKGIAKHIIPPLVVDNKYIVTQSEFCCDAPGVLINTSDIQQQALSVVPFTDVKTTGGTVSCAADGSFVYKSSDAKIDDCFTYQVRNTSGLTAQATVHLFSKRDEQFANCFVTQQNKSLFIGIPGLLGYESPDACTIVLSYNPVSEQDGKVIVFSDGSFYYEPVSHFFGRDWFTYTVVNKKGETQKRKIIVQVNPQLSLESKAYFTACNTVLTVQAPGVLAHAISPDCSQLAVVPTRTMTPYNGTLALSADGSFVYTPALNFSGRDTFYYTVYNEKRGFKTSAITINVRFTPTLPETALSKAVQSKYSR